MYTFAKWPALQMEHFFRVNIQFAAFTRAIPKY